VAAAKPMSPETVCSWASCASSPCTDSSWSRQTTSMDGGAGHLGGTVGDGGDAAEDTSEPEKEVVRLPPRFQFADQGGSGRQRGMRPAGEQETAVSSGRAPRQHPPRKHRETTPNHGGHSHADVRCPPHARGGIGAHWACRRRLRFPDVVRADSPVMVACRVQRTAAHPHPPRWAWIVRAPSMTRPSSPSHGSRRTVAAAATMSAGRSWTAGRGRVGSSPCKARAASIDRFEAATRHSRRAGRSSRQHHEFRIQVRPPKATVGA